MPDRRTKVLLIAESANPEESSVSLEGWSLAQALRKLAEVHVVTHARNRDALERAGWKETRDFTVIDPSKLENPINGFGAGVRRFANLGWTFTTALGTLTYYYIEAIVWRRFADAIKAGEYDLVHRLTPVSPTTPSLLAGRCRKAGVPFLWGPINGGVPWPKEFRSALRREGEWLSFVRPAHRLMPGYTASRKSATALLAGSTSVWEQLDGYHQKTVYVPENGIDPERFAFPETERKPGPLRIAFVGRLVPYKGADMMIDAVAPLVKERRATVDLIGDGPEMPLLRGQIERLGIAAGVSLPGWLSHREVARRLAGSDVFVFPSIREFGGGVVLEAMALGLAPVVVSNGGPAELVTDQTGFRVPLGSRETIVADFRRIVSSLADSPEEVRRIGRRARERVYKQFTWPVKALQILEVYRWALGQREKPDFGMPLPD